MVCSLKALCKVDLATVCIIIGHVLCKYSNVGELAQLS